MTKTPVALIAVAALAFSVSSGASNDPPIADILARAGRYVVEFERDFALLISDEHTEQRLSGESVNGPRVRTTHSEMLFMWVPERWSWLTVRNVLNVDGRAIADSQDRLNRALANIGSSRLTHLRALRELSSRFNLGSIFRTINDPTLALLFLDPSYQPRFNFTLKGQERLNGVDTWKLGFVDQQRPTVIQDNNSDLVATGSIWVGVSDGAVVRTDLVVTIPLKDTIASVLVDYKRNARLEMWVPARMLEGYTQWGSRRVVEHIESVADYSNFRRFETSSRLVVPN